MAHDIPLGREVAYPQHYDPGLLFPISRRLGRDEIGIADAALPFIGHDRWYAYELSWLDARGKPQMATATLAVPADSPTLILSRIFDCAASNDPSGGGSGVDGGLGGSPGGLRAPPSGSTSGSLDSSRCAKIGSVCASLAISAGVSPFSL